MNDISISHVKYFSEFDLEIVFFTCIIKGKSV